MVSEQPEVRVGTLRQDPDTRQWSVLCPGTPPYWSAPLTRKQAKKLERHWCEQAQTWLETQWQNDVMAVAPYVEPETGKALLTTVNGQSYICQRRTSTSQTKDTRVTVQQYASEPCVVFLQRMVTDHGLSVTLPGEWTEVTPVMATTSLSAASSAASSSGYACLVQ